MSLERIGRKLVSDMSFMSPEAHGEVDVSNGLTETKYGSRLLPDVVDALAKSNPDRVYATIPRSADVEQGFYDVTMLEIA